MSKNLTTTLALLAPETDLVFLDAVQKHVYSNALKVAEEFLKAHKNVLQAIENLKANPGISRLTFQPRDYIDERGKVQKTYDISRDGFLLLVMGFTGPKALKVKLRFIEAFNAMESYIRCIEFNCIVAQPARLEGKAHRREFTDAIAGLKVLADAQGGTGGRFLYSHLTKHCYKALGLFAGVAVPDGLRDGLTSRELQDCAFLESVMTRRIERLLELDDGTSYKVIRDEACHAASKAAELLGVAHV
jgi:Rha family phage regulatory protein